MSPDTLAYTAHQIGRFFASQKRDDIVAGIADHLMKFWDPRMRQTIVAPREGVVLDPLVREAVGRLKDCLPV